MKAHPLQALVRHARRLAGAAEPEPRGDADLLSRFIVSRDEPAFEEIVQRHGPLVWAICRTNLNDTDADDAFQATFLVLARQPKSIRKADSLACWLSGVARRTVQSVRARRHRRREVSLPKELSAYSSPEFERTEERHVIAEELERLPEKYRLPMLLCYYQGLTNEEAAKRLNWPHGTVCGRLARARRILQERLTQRGIALTIGSVAAGHVGQPANLIAATLRACSAASANSLQPSIVKLAEATMHAMWIGKVKVAVGTAIVVATLGAGTGWVLSPATAQDDKQTAPKVQVDRPKPVTSPPLNEKQASDVLAQTINELKPSPLAELKLGEHIIPHLKKSNHQVAVSELLLHLQNFQAGARGLSIDKLIGSMKRVFESEIALIAKPADEVAAAMRAYQLAKAVNDVYSARFRTGQGAEQDHLYSLFHLQEMDIKRYEAEAKVKAEK